MEMSQSAHRGIGNTTSELAAALKFKVNWPDLPGKLMAFSESPNLSCTNVGEKVVGDLVEIADSSFPFFQSYLANFMQALFAIAKAPEFKDGMRQMAVEVLLCIVEENKIRKCLSIPEFASEFVPILLELMLKAVDDGDWIDQDIAAIEADAARVYDVCEDLNRIAINIGGENVKNIIFGYISEYLKKDEWQYKLVAAMAITETLLELLNGLSYCSTDILLDKIMEILKLQLKNQHHHVRSTTCATIRRIAKNYSLFQERYAKVSLPLVVNMFNDHSPGVQCEAVAAFNSFGGGILMADVMPFADQIVAKLLERIKPENHRRMREQGIEGLGLMAEVIKKEFLKYYPRVVPVIAEIIIASSTKEEREIRGMAMESFNRFMWGLLDIANPLKKDTQETLRQMRLTFNREIQSYLPHLISTILKVLPSDTQPEVEVMAIVANGKSTELTASDIKEITPAVNLLTTFIEVIGAQFGEYLVPAAQSLLSLLSLPLSYNEKGLVLTALANVFTVARESSDPAIRQMLSLWVAAVLEKVSKDLIPNEIAAGITEFHVISAKETTTGLRKCLRNAGPDVLNAQQVEAICEKVFRLIKESNQRRPKSATRKFDSEQDLRLALSNLIGTVMSHHADLYLQTSAKLCSKFIETHLDPNCSPSDRALALYVFANVLKHLKDKSAPLWPTFASRLVECIGDPDFVVNKAAAYGVIEAAKCPQFPAELIQKAASQLFALINAKQSRTKAFLSATDTMIAALGTIIVHRSSCCLQPSLEQCIHLWISNLPIEDNLAVGQRTHGDLVYLLVQRSHEVLGPRNANLPKLVSICASIYLACYTTTKTKKGIIMFMKNIGFHVISSVGRNFDAQLRRDLERIYRDSRT